MVTIKNPADFPKISAIQPDDYVIGIRAPDTNPEDVLILAQSPGTPGGGGHIIVDNSELVYPNRARLAFTSAFFTVTDNVGDDQTEIGFVDTDIMLESFWTDGSHVTRNRGGFGQDTSSLEGVPVLGTLGGLTTVKYNFSATGSPTASDDSTQDYTIGSRWYFNNEEFVCVNPAPGAAVWNSTTVATGSRHVIQAEGASLTARTNLNFIGTGFTVADNPGADSTDVQLTFSDMQKAVYDTDNNGYIDLSAGGTNADLSASGVGYFFSDGIVGSIIKVDFTTASDPTATDDITEGYSLGSLRYNPNNTSLFFLTDPTEDAAVWLPLDERIRIKDTSDVIQTKRASLKVKSDNGSITVNTTDNAGTDTTEVDLSAAVAPVDYITNPVDTALAIRDTHHGQVILLQGIHDVRFPSSATATIRDGFQCVFQLETTLSTVSFVPEDGGATVNGVDNVLTTQYKAVWAWHRTDGIWTIVGGLG